VEADIEERLRVALNARASTFALANPDEPPRNPTRSHPRRARHSVITHVLPVAAVAAVVALALAFGPFRAETPVAPSRTPAAHPPLSVSIPKGWKTYTYQEAAISVPSSWHTNSCPDPSPPGALNLGDAGRSCSSTPQGGFNYVILSPLSPSFLQTEETYKSTCATKVNGLAIDVVACDIAGNLDNSTIWLVPSLGVEVTALPKVSAGTNSSGLMERVLHTLRAADHSSTGVVTGTAQACAALAYVATARLAVYRGNGNAAEARKDQYRLVVPVTKVNVPTNGTFKLNLPAGHYFITNTGSTAGANPFVISVGHTVYVDVPNGCR
jgi:hypothetical protein